MRTDYLERQRHILLDMHVPDWDSTFLSRFDPEFFVDRCVDAGADAVMVYCNSHVGLCYWPTRSGQMHRGLLGRDVVGEQVKLLRQRDIAVCAYYSGPVFNNWAYTTHPEWRIAPAGPGGMAATGSRYGVVCPNNTDCLSFMLQQTEELASGYPFDAFFFDMVFWPSICVCDSCRDRLKQEEGFDIPESVDWHSHEWSRFQAARERWIADAFRQLKSRVKSSLDIPVFLNGTVIKDDWWTGTGNDLIALSDLVGGDSESSSVLPIMSNSTPTVAQYMKAISKYGGGASDLMPIDAQKVHALFATSFGSQFLAIDAIQPDGGLIPEVYERLHHVFRTIVPYEPFLGGTPVADVGIYWSKPAAVNLFENGTSLDRIGDARHTSPHSLAVDGAVAALQEAHLPFAVLTPADLGRLEEFAVVVLPNVLRMTRDEVEAVERYVAGGGHVYASGSTSLVTTDGTRHEDFLLADIFGCHLEAEEDVPVIYVKPRDDETASRIAPLRYVSHGESAVNGKSFGSPVTALRITAEQDVRVLATTTLPYDKGRGSRDDEGWASIHNSPPWKDTSNPSIVRHRYKAGAAVYSVADIETASGEPAGAGKELFVGLVRSLLSQSPTFSADTHPNVWMTAFQDSENDRMRLCFLNHPDKYPALPVPNVRFRVRPPNGSRFTSLRRIPDGQDIPFAVDEAGTLVSEIAELQTFEMLAATYEHATAMSAAPRTAGRPREAAS